MKTQKVNEKVEALAVKINKITSRLGFSKLLSSDLSGGPDELCFYSSLHNYNGGIRRDVSVHIGRNREDGYYLMPYDEKKGVLLISIKGRNFTPVVDGIRDGRGEPSRRMRVSSTRPFDEDKFEIKLVEMLQKRYRSKQVCFC